MESQNTCKPLRNPEMKCNLKTVIENHSVIKLPVGWKSAIDCFENKTTKETETVLICSTLKLHKNQKVKSTKSVVLSEGENSTIKIKVLLNSKIVNIPFVKKSVLNIEELTMVLKVVDSLKVCNYFHFNRCGTCLLYSLEFDICRPCKDLKIASTKTAIENDLTGGKTSNITEINDIRCRLCNKSLTNLTNLLKHEHCHLPKYDEEKFQCTICNTSFEESNILVEHYGKSHKGVKFIKCILCTDKFSSSRYIRMHMRLHKNSMKYFCKNCDAEFLNNNVFRNHICKVIKRDAIKSKCYICHICHVKFSTNHLLIQHQREHQICISLKCYLCNRVFITKDQLSDHKLHCKLKQLGFACDICNIRFSCISQKTTHMNTLHIKTH